MHQLLEWEESHKGTIFVLPTNIAVKAEEQIKKLHEFLIENYLDATYADLFNMHVPLCRETEYRLSHSDFTSMLDYMDSHIANFKEDFTEALTNALDRTYEYELKLREFEEKLENLIQDRQAVVLWGCGNFADKLFRKYNL